MNRSRRVIRTPVDRRCKVEGTVKTTLKFDFEINHIDTKKKKKKKKKKRKKEGTFSGGWSSIGGSKDFRGLKPFEV
jgi:hypothetical protein